MTNFKRLIASVLIVATTLAGLPLTAQAGIVSTDEFIASSVSAANPSRDRVSSFLARDDVRQALQAQGVSPQVAAERVKSSNWRAASTRHLPVVTCWVCCSRCSSCCW